MLIQLLWPNLADSGQIPIPQMTVSLHIVVELQRLHEVILQSSRVYMPKLLRSSETVGCGATIELDNGDVVYISIAQTGVLVRRWDMNGGLIKSLLSNLLGPKLYNEGNVYKNAQRARALRLMYSEQASPLCFKNPVLAAFSNAIWPRVPMTARSGCGT
jgi:hypothetical protein